MKKGLFSVFAFFLLLMAQGANAQPRYKQEAAFQAGEAAVYNIYFNWGFIWIHAGDVCFNVKESQKNGEKCFDLFVTGKTRSSFDKMYTIRDTFMSRMDVDSSRPFYYKEVKHEDSYYCNKQYNYVHGTDSAQVYMDFVRNTRHWKDTAVVANNVNDLVSTCYKFRNLDMQTVPVNMLVGFNMMFDSEVYKLGLKYCGKETIKLKSGKKYKALKFVPKLITGDLFKNEDDMTIYVSDDDNHVPLLVTAKIKVGSIKAMLSSVKNTKTPMSSELE